MLVELQTPPLMDWNAPSPSSIMHSEAPEYRTHAQACEKCANVQRSSEALRPSWSPDVTDDAGGDVGERS